MFLSTTMLDSFFCSQTNKNYLFRPLNWVYDDDNDMETDEDEPQPVGGNASGGEGGAVSSGTQAVPPKEGKYEPSLTLRWALWL